MCKRLTALTVLFILGAFSGSITVFAQDANDMRAQAESEIQQTGEIKTKSTDAQVSESMLKLDDPMPNLRGRSWDYFLGLSVQSFTPRGRGSNDLSNADFDVSEAGGTVMPALAIGFRNNLVTLPSVSILWGVGGRVGYTTEKGAARFSTGYVEKNAKLNSTLLHVDPFLAFKFARAPRWLLNVKGEVGSINYVQSSDNKLAAFSEHANFYGAGVGVEYAISNRWAAFADYVHRQRTSLAKAELQAENLELGAKVLW